MAFRKSPFMVYAMPRFRSINFLKKMLSFSNFAYALWDRGDKIEVDLLANPEIARKMYDYNKVLIEVCEEKYLPSLKQIK